MDTAAAWKECFSRWPDDIPRRGVLVTSYDEQILFSGFMTGAALLLVERAAPDTVGARQVLIPYGNIVAIKITDVVKTRAFQELGFEGKRPAK